MSSATRSKTGPIHQPLTPEVVEVHRVSGEDYVRPRAVACDVEELQAVVDRFVPLASTYTAIF